MVAAISELEPQMEPLSDEQLRAKTEEFRRQLADGATLDDLSCPAFAVVREAARRAVGLRPFDVQLIGGIVLHEGKIAEMKTGEGKTLVATLPVYLNALAGKGVHVVTVNDYLARRDAEWMGTIYRFLGLTVGVHPARHRRGRAPAGLRRRRHLRHEQRVRLRLSARQHEVRPRPDGPARPLLRHRRRGRLDPDRRGADAADHLRPVRGVGRQVLPHRPHHPAAGARRGDRARRRLEVDQRRLPGRREGAHRGAHRRRRLQGREAPRGRQPLRHGEHGADPRHQPGAARAPPVQARRRVPGQGRPGRHRRRVHRPHDARPALVRRPAPGGRGQGGRARSSARTRRSPRSPSRTTSGCTRSSPA